MKWLRLALEDSEDQDLSESFTRGLAIIDEVAQSGGRVLIHCHEGKSRSVSLCLAYLISRQRRSLDDALAFVKSRRREARPNAGFWKQLLQLEFSVLGTNSKASTHLPKGKPKGYTCEVCGEMVGLTAGSLAAHMKQKHRDHCAYQA